MTSFNRFWIVRNKEGDLSAEGYLVDHRLSASVFSKAKTADSDEKAENILREDTRKDSRSDIGPFNSFEELIDNLLQNLNDWRFITVFHDGKFWCKIKSIDNMIFMPSNTSDYNKLERLNGLLISKDNKDSIFPIDRETNIYILRADWENLSDPSNFPLNKENLVKALKSEINYKVLE